MSDQQKPDDVEDFGVISPDDIAHVIELDDNGDMSEEIGEMELTEDQAEQDEEDNGDGEMMEAFALDVKDMADRVFSKHTDAIFSVNIDPRTSDLAVTGGQDDRAFVWKLSTGEVVLECTGHKDSVTCTGFSHDGVYVATADLAGLVKVWKVDTKEEVWSFECSDAEWLRWHPASHVLFLGTVDGDVWMWKIPSGDCKTIQSPGCTASCGVIMGDGKRACIGYNDGTLRIWDLKTGTVQHSVTGSAAHQSTVICVDSHSESNLIVSGSTDVTAKIVNGASGKVLGTVDCSSADAEEDSVEAVGFSHSHNYVATGSLAGMLCIWDLNTQQCRHRCKHNAGIVQLQWDRLSPLVYTSCLDGAVRLWDARNGEMVSKWTGHTDAILGFDISRDGNTLVTVSEDKSARVFSLGTPER